METRSLTSEEWEALSKDINEVLIKHNAQMSVKSTIELTKMVEDEIEETAKID